MTRNICHSIVKTTGERCNRKAWPGSRFCWTHVDKKKPIIIAVIGGLLVMGIGRILDKCTTSSEERNLQNLLAENKELKGRMIDFQTLSTLMPGNKPDPPTTARDKLPVDAIKLYLGSCIAWWSPNILHTYSVVTINNEPVLTLCLEENGLFLSGKIRRPKDGREVMNLINNKFVRNPNAFVEPQRPSEHELIVSGESGERLLYVNYLNEKAIAIEGTFYDSQGNWILTINDREIVDMADNHFLPGASFGGNENIFSYQTLLRPYQLTVTVTQPALINTGYRIDYMCDGRVVENPSEATVIVSNTGVEPIRLGLDGELELATTEQVIDIKMSPPGAMSDYIERNGKVLKFTSLIINPGETKTINVLMQGEGKCDVSRAKLRDGGKLTVNGKVIQS